MNDENPPLTISIEEAGKMLGVGRNTAYAAANQGTIPVIRIGRRLMVPYAAFQKMLDASLAAVKAPLPPPEPMPLPPRRELRYQISCSVPESLYRKCREASAKSGRPLWIEYIGMIEAAAYERGANRQRKRKK